MLFVLSIVCGVSMRLRRGAVLLLVGVLSHPLLRTLYLDLKLPDANVTGIFPLSPHGLAKGTEHGDMATRDCPHRRATRPQL